MTVYKLTCEGMNGPVVFDSLFDVVEEVRMHLSEGIESVTVEQTEMSREAFESLKEHEGY